MRGFAPGPAFSDPKSWAKLTAAMAISGAGLGPLLDNYHSAFGVLLYAAPKNLRLPVLGLLSTDTWVPPLFALAGVIIGLGVVLLECLAVTHKHPELEGAGQTDARISVPAVLQMISAYTAQYYASGALTALDLHPYTLAVLATVSGSLLALCSDQRLRQSAAILGLAAAIGGPLIEIALISKTHLYSYYHPDVWGVPYFIPGIYFGGGPAVGTLAVAVAQRLGILR